MCVRCLAAQRSLNECDDGEGSSGALALDDTTKAASAPSVNDYRSILYYLDGGSNFRWNADKGLGTSVMVTYSFGEGSDLPSTFGSSSNPYGASSFSDFTNAQRNNFRIAAAEFMAVSGIVLVEVEDGGDINVFNAHGTNVGGYADLPYVNGSYQSQVELVIDSSGNYDAGSYGYFTILHELGHAVGLDHTHEGAYTLNSGMDTTASSVMSYNYDASALGLQSLDDDALEHIYGGRVMSAGWSFSFNDNKSRFDANGSSSNDSLAVPVNVDGSSVATKIMGQNGNDTITGQNSVDLLRGNKGNDYLSGIGGDDKLRGGGGQDTIYGGTGDDYLNGGSGSDTIYAGAGDDYITGGSASDDLNGQADEDLLFGKLGDDSLDGGSSADTLEGGKGDDQLTGGIGQDTFVFRATSEHDTISDFDTNGEILQFKGTGFDYSDVTVSTESGHARIEVGTVVIDLLGVSAGSISADDFQFI